MNDETIASIATAGGFGAISIIRVSGANALKIAERLTKKTSITPRYANLFKLYSQEHIIDEAIVIYFNAPKSYTGQDVVEFQTHGGFSVASIVLDEILRSRLARLALPGEFSKIAVLNGKMSMDKAETIAAMISSKSLSYTRLLSRHLSGDLERFLAQIRKSLLEMIAHSEVCIDYADEDLPLDLASVMAKKLQETQDVLQKTLEKSSLLSPLADGFKIAIVGKPNVGKSSILNALLSRPRAIVSDKEGTTRDTIEAQMQIGEQLVIIADTAGIRQTAEQVEAQGISYSKTAIKEANLVVAVFDASKEFSAQDDEILALTKDAQTVFVLNKTDIPSRFEPPQILKGALKISAAQNNISALLDEIKARLNAIDTQEEILVSKRQMDLIQEAVENLAAARLTLDDGALELFSHHLNAAIELIATVTKPFERDEILDEMFGTFCLGK